MEKLKENDIRNYYGIAGGVFMTPYGDFKYNEVAYYEDGAIKGIRLVDNPGVESVWFTPDGFFDQVITWNDLI